MKFVTLVCVDGEVVCINMAMVEHFYWRDSDKCTELCLANHTEFQVKETPDEILCML